ncbi:hypothetical protein OIE67_19085 [Nonomuraea fuscirosea]|uniref:hypothetical protein n=1 Tax=Nonomuraea fuscirosea TaxID=1291556 RepID=UPI002DD938FA|nr:hypothetical protein [Nonomuraea fuscirosea]WSA56638.1 hypothetical protein OIE67_19085 [Nonomuraea fuscirosea]
MGGLPGLRAPKRLVPVSVEQPRLLAGHRVPAALDLDLALDLLVGLTQWRVLNTGRTVDDAYVEATSELIIQALPFCLGAGDRS